MDHLREITDIIRCEIISEISHRQIKKSNSDQINTILTYFSFINPLKTLYYLRNYIWQAPICEGTPDELYEILNTKIQNLKNYSLNHQIINVPPKIENLDIIAKAEDENKFDTALLQKYNEEIDEIFESSYSKIKQLIYDNVEINQENDLEDDSTEAIMHQLCDSINGANKNENDNYNDSFTFDDTNEFNSGDDDIYFLYYFDFGNNNNSYT